MVDGEIGMSRNLIENNINIGSVLYAYKGTPSSSLFSFFLISLSRFSFWFIFVSRFRFSLTSYLGVDFRKDKQQKLKCNNLTNIWSYLSITIYFSFSFLLLLFLIQKIRVENGYFGIYVSPYEVVFVKNSHVFPYVEDQVNLYSKWANNGPPI